MSKFAFIDDYSGFAYTSVEVPIILKECPADFEDHHYFIDIAASSFEQQDCYIGNQKVLNFKVERLSTALENQVIREPKWIVKMIFSGAVEEDQVLHIIDLLCEKLSLNCALNHSLFQYCGLMGFSYRNIDVKRRYAKADYVFGDVDYPRYGGMIGFQSHSTIPYNIFSLPDSAICPSPLHDRLCKAFLRALRARDAVSRYILLYYMFEILYDTDDYQAIKEEYAACGKKGSGCRSEILCDYLRRAFQFESYHNFEGDKPLTSAILAQLIETRNDLTHRADESQVIQLMYLHLIPISQKLLNLINEYNWQ